MQASYRGKRIGLLAPLVVARKGFYTDLAKWAAQQGLQAPARRRRRCCRPSSWPRLDRFKEHTIELPVAEIDVDAKNETRSCAQALDARARARQGRGARARPRRRMRADGAGLLDEARLPVLRHAASPSSIRACSPTTPSTAGARAASAPGSRSSGFDEEQSGEEICVERRGSMARDRRACAACDGQRLNRIALHVRFRDRSIAALTRAGRSTMPRDVLRRSCSCSGREARDRARPARRDRVAARLPRATSASAISRSTAPRRRCRAARRSASGSRRSSAPTCRASATCSTSRPSACTRATTAILLDALARARRTRATRWWWSSTTRTPSAAPTTSSTSAPAPGVRGGEVVGAGHRRGARCAIPTRSPAASCASRCSIRSQPRRAVDARDAALERRAASSCTTCKDVDVRVPLGRLVGRHRRVGLGQVHARARRAATTNLKRLRRQADARRKAAPSSPAAAAIAAASRSTACSKSTRRRSARRRAPAPRPTSASGTTIRKLFADTHRGAHRAATRASRFSFNTGGRPLRRPAKARACRRSR